MNQILNVPDSVTDAGLGFNYAVWTPGTVVELCNVSWQNTYRDIVKYDSPSDLDAYLSRPGNVSIEISGMSYVRPNTPIRVNVPFGTAIQFNYIRVSNPAQPVGGDVAKVFYYFILDVKHIAPNTTELIVQLDVWQTFNWYVNFGRCYLLRGHAGIANTARNYQNGRYHLTIPEGLDLGSNLTVVGARSFPIVTPDVYKKAQQGVAYDYVRYVIVSTVDLALSGGGVSDPVLVAANGSAFQGMPSGAEYFIVPDTLTMRSLMNSLSTMPWVSQGIIAVYAVPNLFQDLSTNASLAPITVGGTTIYRVLGTGEAISSWSININDDVDEVDVLTGFNVKQHLLNSIPERYRHLTKFLTYPYSAAEVSLYNGQTLILQPEMLPSSGRLHLRTATYLGQPSPRVAIYPDSYNLVPVASDYDLYTQGASIPNFGKTSWGEGLSIATVLSDFPQFPIVNNMYLSYMASNARQIAFQHSSADWSQQRALVGAQSAFENATNSIDTAAGLNAAQQSSHLNQQNLAMDTLAYRSIQGGVNNAISGGMSGGTQGAVAGPVGAAAGAVAGAAFAGLNAVADYAISANQLSQQGAITRSLMGATSSLNIDHQSFVRDTNKAYSDYAARGDYENTIAGINAKVQDAKIMQPTTSGQMGGDAMILAETGAFMGRIVLKRVDNAVIRSIGDYWCRYGYAINRFVDVGDVRLMENFTYWKMSEVNINAGPKCPEGFRNTIRGIFEKGVTVWSDATKIFNHSIYDNPAVNSINF